MVKSGFSGGYTIPLEKPMKMKLDTVPFKRSGDWFKAIFSKTLLFFYVTILIVIGIVLLWQLIGQDKGI